MARYIISKYLNPLEKSSFINFYDKTNMLKQIGFMNKGNNVGDKYYVFAMKLEDEFFTEKIKKGQKHKILRIDCNNQNQFKNYNYIQQRKNHFWHIDCPYPSYYICHKDIYDGYSGIDANNYDKKDIKESISNQGIVWNNDNLPIEISLISEIFITNDFDHTFNKY
jgi:hypothetical protein